MATRGDVDDGGSPELSVLRRLASTVGRTLDLQAVLECCLDLADELMDASRSTIYLVDESTQTFEMVAQRNLPVEVAAAITRMPREYVERVRARGPEPHIVDMSQYDEPMRSLSARHGVVLTVSLPLIADGVLVGLHALSYLQDRIFLPSTLGTLMVIGEHEASAIDRARVHALAELRARLSEIVREVAERALSTTSDDAIADALLDGICRICGSNAARLALLDEEGALCTARARGMPDGIIRAIASMPHDDPSLRRFHAAPGPIVIDGADDLSAGSMPRRVFIDQGLRSLVVLPLRLRGQLIGTISCASTVERRFHPAELNALSLLSSVAASAIEAHRLRTAAEAERRRLGDIIDRVPLPVAVIDRQGRFEQVNAAYRTMNDRAVRGAWFQDSLAPLELRRLDGTPLRVDQLNTVQALASEDPLPLELRVKSNAGWRSMISHAAALRDWDGTVSAVVLALQDVTALRDLADAKDRFLDVASHELRSPLSALHACTSLLELDPRAGTDPERRAGLIRRIHQQSERLGRLVDELVDMAQLRGGTLRLRCERMDLADAARETAELAQLQTQQHLIRIDGRDPVEGSWDRARLIQVITNLLSNAMRYSPDGGEIAMAVRIEGDTAVLSVRDSGIGIPPAQQRRLFEPYHRGREAGEIARGGLGLGLYITLEIVRRHGGRIEVESEIGRGSRFTVVLPLDSSALQPPLP